MTHSIGDPNHIGVHNQLATDVGDLADQMSVDVDLPPQRNLGDLGHTDDHNKLQAAIDKIAAGAIPGLNPAPIIDGQVSSQDGPEVQEWLVKDKQGNRKVVYFLPGNTGTARSLALTDEGAEALQARRELLDAIATTEVPEDFEGDPVTLLPKKLREELTGFVEVRAASQPEAVYSVTLGAGVLPGVMVGAGGQGGGASAATKTTGGGGAGGVVGQGAHVPVILPVQGTATYTVKVASTTVTTHPWLQAKSQSTSIAVQGQEPFSAAAGGGFGTSVKEGSAHVAGQGGSGGGAGGWSDSGNGLSYQAGAPGIPGQGNKGGAGLIGGSNYSGGGGGYGSAGNGPNGGDGFDLATALNLDPNDGITGSFLDQVSVNGWIAGGGTGGYSATASAGGGTTGGGHAKDYSGGGGAFSGSSATGTGGKGGAGAVYIITDPT